MDQSKKYFVGQTTNVVVGKALEEIFFRMVLTNDGTGPVFVGKVDQRIRFPDLSHPSQLCGEEFLEFMGAGAKSNLTRAQWVGKLGDQNSHFDRRSNTSKRDGNPENVAELLVEKTLDIDLF